MRGFRSTLVVLSFLFLALPARAGLLIEPYLGYGFGPFNNSSGGQSNSNTMSGAVLGGRLGLTIPLFFFVADYSMFNGKLSNSNSDTLTGSNLFFDVGVSLPFVRAYIGYSPTPLTTAVDKASGGDFTFKGTGLKIGASFTALPIIALNLEYVTTSYSHFSGQGYDQDIGGSSLFTAATSNFYMLSVSAPFDL